MNRVLGLATFVIMLCVNTALFLRDIAPRWWAGDPPLMPALQIPVGQELGTQIGVYDATGQRIGYCWTIRSRSPEVLTVRTTMVLIPRALPGNIEVSRLRIDTEFSYLRSHQLDTLAVQVRGLGVPVRLAGEFVPPNDFPCQWQVADRRGEFVIPAMATRALGDAVRPFHDLGSLEVGQTWKIEVLNPLAALFPSWDSSSMNTVSIVATVSGMEWIDHGGLGVQAWVVDSERARAWVAPSGRVVRQEVTIPMFGRLVLLDEPYDDDARRRFMQATAGD